MHTQKGECMPMLFYIGPSGQNTLLRRGSSIHPKEEAGSRRGAQDAPHTCSRAHDNYISEGSMTLNHAS